MPDLGGGCRSRPRGRGRPGRRACSGGLVGWAVSKPLNRVLGWFFDLFNRGFTATASVYSRLVGGMLRVFVLVFLVYVGLLLPDLRQVPEHAAGLHPVAGHGLHAGQHPASRLGLARADPGGDRQISEIAIKTEGVAATVGIAGQSLLLNAYGSNFGTMFVTLEEFDERDDRRTTVLTRPSRTSCAASSPQRGPRGQHRRSSARRRCAAWAGPAAGCS